MALEWLLDPVSAELPCGPDLLASGDEEYLAFVRRSEGDLPQTFIGRYDDNSDVPVPFPRENVDLRKIHESTDRFLAQSRDLRLLTLRARWECFAGKPAAMADTIEAIAALIETFGDDVHPATEDRSRALVDLKDPPSILISLQFLPLGTTEETSLRAVRVAREEQAPKFKGEDGLSFASIESELRSRAAREEVTARFEALGRLAAAYRRLQAVSHAGDYGKVVDLLDQMRSVMRDARPDLEPEVPAEDTEEITSESDGPEHEPALAIGSQDEARHALAAVESYYRNHEPSAATLLLVTQARQLVGVTLIEAIGILMPDRASEAAFRLPDTEGVRIGSDRLKDLGAMAMGGEGAAHDPGAESKTFPEVGDRRAVASVLHGVERYYRIREPSSPIPMLLAQARSMIDKDFGALMEFFLPSQSG